MYSHFYHLNWRFEPTEQISSSSSNSVCVCCYVCVFCLLGAMWACSVQPGCSKQTGNKQSMPQHRGNLMVTRLTELSYLSFKVGRWTCRLSPLTAWWCVGVWTVWDSGSRVWSSRRHRGCGSSACLGSSQPLYGLLTDAHQLKTQEQGYEADTPHR